MVGNEEEKLVFSSSIEEDNGEDGSILSVTRRLCVGHDVVCILRGVNIVCSEFECILNVRWDPLHPLPLFLNEADA
jgi:hypothetical protein